MYLSFSWPGPGFSTGLEIVITQSNTTKFLHVGVFPQFNQKMQLLLKFRCALDRASLAFLPVDFVRR